MSKRYYWLKLKEDFFNQPLIRAIERGQHGGAVLLFYLKLLALAIRSEGRLRISEAVPYDVEGLADDTRTDPEVAALAAERLQEVGFLMLDEDGTYILPALSEMIGSETEDAKRMRTKREQCSNNVRQSKSIEKEKEKEIEKDILSGGAATYQQVDLTDEQMDQLKELMGPGKAITYIGKLEQLISSRNTKIKDPYQTILKWYREDCK